MRKHDEYTQRHGLDEIKVAVTRLLIETPPGLHVPYEGNDPQVAAAFPQGFPPSYGSGLACKGLASDGGIVLYCLTDRGPNGDGPAVALPGTKNMESKIFPAPSFKPSVGVLHVSGERAVLTSSLPLRSGDGSFASGLPIPQGTLGSADEMPLPDSLQTDPALFSMNGIDSEAIAYDPVENVLWITDEYGPFLLKVDPATGMVQKRYGPGSGLPAVLAKRRPNRGMEGMTFDPSSALVHAFLQSPLSDGKAHYALTGSDEKVERYAAFVRWIVFDPATGATRKTLAYPLDHAAYAKGRTGNAKLGDLVALGAGKFIVIEQGEGPDGHIFNHLMLVDINGASDIGAYGSALERSSMRGKAVDGADWRAVTPLRKTLLLDLRRIGWLAEKAEGLALVDAHTLAMSNDNDFGMKTRLFDAAGHAVADADVTQVTVDADGTMIDGARAGDVMRVSPGDPDERALTLWMLRFAAPLASLSLE
ncbi:esterase-like activity of phytase family protein [Massilia sp. CF038]|uniref:esterase-like activity of phytase family protein n=1 Tax=Massilia sp. CF038 TaxID=1881045 RepID=UPI0009220670|nr:esterase-like activity of phytase family protein [Massilia sp. CF038]SHH57454.1 Esterase-like activity of phytase [Massilia sp. CF038]